MLGEGWNLDKKNTRLPSETECYGCTAQRDDAMIFDKHLSRVHAIRQTQGDIEGKSRVPKKGKLLWQQNCGYVQHTTGATNNDNNNTTNVQRFEQQQEQQHQFQDSAEKSEQREQ